MEAESRLGVDKMCKRQKELFCKKTANQFKFQITSKLQVGLFK